LTELKNDQEIKESTIRDMDNEIEDLSIKCNDLNDKITEANELEKEVQGFENKIHLLKLSISNIESTFTKLSGDYSSYYQLKWFY
jgi:predicted RNase H-like nuclease (RuvC/YqgF family)